MEQKHIDLPKNMPPQISINLDTTPVLYTDMIRIQANDDGVVLNVIQKIGESDALRIVSRVGMSREHAKKLAQQMSKLLGLTEKPKDKLS